MVFPGRLGVLTPSERHVPQTAARWRASGFDAHVAPLSPYEERDPAAVRRAADALRAGGAGLVVMDCIGFRRKTRDENVAVIHDATLDRTTNGTGPVASLTAAELGRLRLRGPDKELTSEPVPMLDNVLELAAAAPLPWAIWSR